MSHKKLLELMNKFRRIAGYSQYTKIHCFYVQTINNMKMKLRNQLY